MRPLLKGKPMIDKIAVFDSPTMAPTLKSLNGRPLINNGTHTHAFVLLTGSKVMAVTSFERNYLEMTDDEVDTHIAAVLKHYISK